MSRPPRAKTRREVLQALQEQVDGIEYQMKSGCNWNDLNREGRARLKHTLACFKQAHRWIENIL